MKSRVQLYIDSEDLAKVDAAVRDSGENRSTFMMKAALARVRYRDATFTPEQFTAIRDIVLHTIDGLNPTPILVVHPPNVSATCMRPDCSPVPAPDCVECNR